MQSGQAESQSTSAVPFGARQHVEVFRVSCRGPGDLEGVVALIEGGELNPAEIVAVMGKTEGNGCVNDYTREYAAQAWGHMLASYLACTPDEALARTGLVMSGGTEGVLSPHFTIFTRREAAQVATGDKRLVIGVAQTRDFAPHELGRTAQIAETEAAVRAAMIDAGIAAIEDVHFVQVKCPLLTSLDLQEALRSGKTPVTFDTYESMAYSRGASALGVALALDEITERDPEVLAERICRDESLWSGRASASSGVELAHNVVLVLGMAEGATSPYVIDHTVMVDAIDAASVRRMLRERFALDADFATEQMQARLVNLLAKAEADPRGQVRGQRHTMLTDSDVSSTRHARAAVGAVLASVAGHPALYISGGAEHQGPPGGGPVAAILRTSASTSGGA